MPTRDIYLIRHAQSEWNAKGLWQGQADPPLSERGRQEVAALPGAMPIQRVDAIHTSDLIRAMETARPLAAAYDVELVVDTNLRELDVGSWSGRSREEIGETEPEALDKWYQGVAGWQGGESYEVHEERSARAGQRLADLDVDVAIGVTHGGTLRAIVLALLGIDPDQRWRFAGLHHVAITHLSLSRHGYRLVTYNRPVIASDDDVVSDLQSL